MSTLCTGRPRRGFAVGHPFPCSQHSSSKSHLLCHVALCICIYQACVSTRTCTGIVNLQDGCVTCRLCCRLLVNVYKYAIKHLQFCFLFPYTAFFILFSIQLMLSVWLELCLKMGWILMQARCVLGHRSFRGLGCSRQERFGESAT